MAFVRWGVDWRLTVVILHHAHSQLLSFDVTCLKKLCVISIIWIKSCIFASQHPVGRQCKLSLPLGDHANYPSPLGVPPHPSSPSRERGCILYEINPSRRDTIHTYPSPFGRQYILIPLPLGVPPHPSSPTRERGCILYGINPSRRDTIHTYPSPFGRG